MRGEVRQSGRKGNPISVWVGVEGREGQVVTDD